MALALRLYERFGLDVAFRREAGDVAMSALRSEGGQFNMAFVDGMHEGLWPVCDAAMAIGLLRQGGMLCLDDIDWPDIGSVARLLGDHLETVHRTDTQLEFVFKSMLPGTANTN